MRKNASILVILTLAILTLCSFVQTNSECVDNTTTMTVSTSCKSNQMISHELNESQMFEFNINVDYAELMVRAAADGDIALGKEYERLRELKKTYLNIKDDVTFDDLYLLSKIVEAEAGSYWITDEHKQLVASVVINRVNSSEFPNTIYEVIYQKNGAFKQYAPAGTEYFEKLVPSESSVRNALTVLQHGSIAPQDVVFQANFKQGSGVYKVFKPDKLKCTYFCYSSHPELYTE